MFDTLQLIVAAIVPGYLFHHYDNKSQYTSPFTPDRLLYTKILFQGILFTTIAILISPILLYFYKNGYPNIRATLKEIYPSDLKLLKHIFIMVVAICISWGSAKARNIKTRFSEKNFHVDFLLEHGTELQKFATKVIISEVSDSDNNLLVEVRLKNDMVYIGLPAEISEPTKPNYVEYFYLLPFHSGYRDLTTHSLVLKTHYIDHYNDVLAVSNTDSSEEQDRLFDHFKIAICAEEIVTIRQFDPDLYFDRINTENDASTDIA